MYIFLNRLLELFPVFISFLMMQLFAFNDGTMFHYSFLPAISAICVFYWAFNYPEVVGTLSVFIIGLISDIIFLNPIGTESFSLLMAYLLTIGQREIIIKYGFLLLWISFSIFLLIFMFFKMLLLAIFANTLIFDFTILTQFLLTVLLYPLIHKVFGFLHIKRIVSLRI